MMSSAYFLHEEGGLLPPGSVIKLVGHAYINRFIKFNFEFAQFYSY